jgi:hypothetical protein
MELGETDIAMTGAGALPDESPPGSEHPTDERKFKTTAERKRTKASRFPRLV